MSAMLCEKGTCAERFNCPLWVPLSEILHLLNGLDTWLGEDPRTIHQPPVLLSKIFTDTTWCSPFLSGAHSLLCQVRCLR